VTEPAIAVEGLWQVFGDNAASVFRRVKSESADKTAEALLAEGLIPAVRDGNFNVAPGELFVVMGLSGSGKSTLIRGISRLLEPTSGRVTIEGEDVLAASKARMTELRRSTIGMVFQHFGLFPHMSVIDNVAFPLKVGGMKRRPRHDKVREIIEMVGLAGREEAYPRELSGGQRQRVGIARSLAGDCSVWFLDEPFSALDPLIRREMQDEFLRLQEMLGKTIVFITHDFDEALRLADRIAIMKDGAIEQCDTPDQVVLNPATEYVAKFTEEIDKARVVHAGILAGPINGATGEPVPAGATIHDLARQLVVDPRDALPVSDGEGRIIGDLDRQKATCFWDRPHEHCCPSPQFCADTDAAPDWSGAAGDRAFAGGSLPGDRKDL
jgi:glycine betaine/proline transport system ATP-binding protein